MIIVLKDFSEEIITKPDTIKLILIFVFCLVLACVGLKNLFFGRSIHELGESLAAGILCLFFATLLLKGLEQNTQFKEALSVAIEEQYSVSIDGKTADINAIGFDEYENISINVINKEIIITTSEE